MPGVPNCWVWDSCFMALYARYSNGALPALSNLDNLYRQQAEDGFIAMAYRMDQGMPAYGKRINPPLFAWAEREWFKHTGDLSRIRRVLPSLVRLFDWYKENRRKPDGLYWFEDSGSTGMDNSPRSGYASEWLNGSDICHVDLISQQAHSAECIAWMAGLIDEHALAERFRNERRELLRLIEKHWCARSGFYHDLFYHTSPDRAHNYVNHHTIAGFWPMFAGACNASQASLLVQALFDPEDFYTPHPVATLSRKDPNYHPEGCYWLGGVWAPTNYMVVRALCRYGYHQEARTIVARHLDAMSRVAEDPAYGGIWECYAPEIDAPATTADNRRFCRPNFVGWSGLGPISMLIENVIGIECDFASGMIRWILTEASSIENLTFGNARVSLYHDGKGRIEVIATSPLNLQIIRDGHSCDCRVENGVNEIAGSLDHWAFCLLSTVGPLPE